MRNKVHYPHQSYQRLYSSTTGPLWSAAEGLPPDEDGDHYKPEQNFFEWWYFDAAFDNGYRLVAALHSSLFNAADRKPTVDVRVTPPAGASKVVIGRYKRDDYRGATDHCDVRIADCRAIAECSNRYTLHLHQRGISADLVYESHLLGWRAGTGYLFADDATGHFFKWVVPLPMARVTGTLRLADQTMTVQGVGYHDHNWGNLILSNAFSRWYWGRLYAADWGVIFGDVVGHGPDPAHVTPFLLIAGDRIWPGAPSVTFRHRDEIVEPVTGVRYPSRLDVLARDVGYQADVSLNVGRVMEALDFASPRFRPRWLCQAAEIAFYLSKDKPIVGGLARRLLGKASYLRLQAQASLTIHTQEAHLTGDAIYEIMWFPTGCKDFDLSEW